MPGVVAAIRPRSTSGASGTPRVCTSRIASRPARSGGCTATRRSKRPGRSSAGSSTSGRLVARDHDHARRRVEPVHLGEDLVQRLLALVVAAAEAGDARRARAADRVELVDEDDRRRGLLRLREEVAHARRADADDRLDELGRGHREERDVGLAGDRPREQRLARARRAARAARRAGSGRRASGTSRGGAGSRRPPSAPPSPRRSRRRRRT